MLLEFLAKSSEGWHTDMRSYTPILVSEVEFQPSFSGTLLIGIHDYISIIVCMCDIIIKVCILQKLKQRLLDLGFYISIFRARSSASLTNFFLSVQIFYKDHI